MRKEIPNKPKYMCIQPHKGKELKDVPASYLIWLYGKIKSHNWKSYVETDYILEYVELNREVLEREKADEDIRRMNNYTLKSMGHK